MTPRRDAGARLGRGRRRVRHRRRLRRSPELRDGAARPAARGGGAIASRSSASPTGATCEPWRAFGRPRLFFAVSAGNMDSMINHYTANRKVRNDDAYSPGGADRPPARPRDARLLPARRARRSRRVPVIAGGVEASLRRIAHYDYWSDKVRRSILLDAKADLVVFGMGERAIVEIARPPRPRARPLRDLRDLRGVAYRLGASEAPPGAAADVALDLPSYEDASSSRRRVAFCEMTRIAHHETNPLQRPAARPAPRPRARGRESAGAAAHAGRDGPRLRPAASRASRTPPTASSEIPAFEVVKDFGPDHARLLRRLHLLLDHRARGPDHPEPQPRSRSSPRFASMTADPAFKGVDQRHRRPDGQHVRDALHAARGRGRCAGG